MTLLPILATMSGTASGSVTLVQAYKIFKRKSAKDISGFAWFFFLFGTTVWTLYGIEIKNFVVIITNSIGIVSNGLVLLGWFLYGRNKTKNVL